MSKVLALIILVVAVFMFTSLLAMILWNAGVGDIIGGQHHIRFVEAMLLTAFASLVTATGRGGSSS